MAEVSDAASAALQDDASRAIAFAYHRGDEAIPKAVRAPSSRRLLGRTTETVR
jgi:hypothetical protein